MQNWGKYCPRSYHTCSHIRNVHVSHPRAQLTQLTPTSSSAQADVWASCLEQKDHYKLCVWTMGLNSASLPRLHWISAWPSLLDNASVLSARCLISCSVCLRFAKHGHSEPSWRFHAVSAYALRLLYKNRNSKQVLRAMFQPASLGLLIQAAIWLGALINQASGVDRKHLQPAARATKSKTQQELLISSMKQSSEN